MPPYAILEGCKRARDAKKKAPWAAKVVKCDGGYLAFGTITDYQTWKAQK